MTRKEIFIAAHFIAKTKKATLNVAYRIALSIALKEVYNSAKQPKKNMENVTTLNIVEIVGNEKLNQDFSDYQEFRDNEFKFKYQFEYKGQVEEGRYNLKSWNGTVYGKGTEDSPYHIYINKEKYELYAERAEKIKRIAAQKTAFESILKTKIFNVTTLETLLRQITEVKYRAETDQFTQAKINVEDLSLVSNIEIRKIKIENSYFLVSKTKFETEETLQVAITDDTFYPTKWFTGEQAAKALQQINSKLNA